MPKRRVYYFGCHEESGHYLFDHRMNKMHEYLSIFPSDFPVHPHALDGWLMPPKTESRMDQGLAFSARINGWTIITFNDNSIDTRGGSHSAFVVEDELSVEDALEEARRVFPHIFARYTFEVRPLQKRGKGSDV